LIFAYHHANNLIIKLSITVMAWGCEGIVWIVKWRDSTGGGNRLCNQRISESQIGFGVGTSRKAFNYDRLSLVVRLDGFLVGGEKWVERTGREKEEKEEEEEEEEGRGRKGRECLPFPAWQETHPGRRRKAFGGLDRHRHLNDWPCLPTCLLSLKYSEERSTIRINRRLSK